MLEPEGLQRYVNNPRDGVCRSKDLHACYPPRNIFRDGVDLAPGQSAQGF
jgi:hypothetical protein